MQKLHFYKYQGTGNDFVIIDDREALFPREDSSLIRRLCDRKFGVGADGLILINLHSEYGFKMTYYNADATTSMCGNGSRCAVHLANHLGIVDHKCRFIAEDGAHEAIMTEDGQVRIGMVDVDKIIEAENGYFLNTGTRHYVRLVDSLADFDVTAEGKKIRYAEKFMPEGTNASFAQITDGQVHMRIYERGVEAETLSSGTGVTAVAMVLARFKGVQSPVSINTKGGILTISFEQTADGRFINVLMAGPAVMVFEGTVFE